MKHLIFLFCVVSLSFTQVFSQKHSTDALKTESEGYFTHPAYTAMGIIATDNYASKIYLIKNNELQELIATPGCGRYFSVSPDKTKIGFKLIKKDGMQVPAVYDLSTKNITELHDPVDLCGQVSFSSDGKIAYTIGNDLFISKNQTTKIYSIGVYSNIVPISPNGDYAIFNNNNDQLFVIDLSTGLTNQITDNSQGYVYPQWSPNGSKITYSTLSGTIMVLDLTSQITYSIGKGENAVWSQDSRYIYYDIITSENFKFKGSEIFISKFDGSIKNQLTNTPDVNEMFPCIVPNNKIIFSTYNDREIISATINSTKNLIQNQTLLIKAASPFIFSQNEEYDFSQKKSKAITMVQGDVPYVNQVYDTPDWHSGYWSCAPSTAIMALGYYNRLPYWDITCSSPSSHTSHYGSYVADYYRYNELYYNSTANDYAGNPAYGGYGYMWTGSNSPSSMMATYFQNHNVTSAHSYSTTFANVQSEINNSHPFSICSMITTSGHLTLAVGYVIGQNTLIFNDPYGDKNDGYMNFYGKNSYYDWPGANNGYQNLNSIAWTVTSVSNEPVYNDTIIDDIFYNHGFYIYNQSLALMRYYRDGKTGGYNNHYWWTYTSSSTTIDTCYVKWTPTIPTNGNYEIFAYIPSSGATATAARYKIFYNGGNTTSIINQATHPGQWVSLGIFNFTSGSAGYVRLGDAAGYQSQQIAFDALKWNFIPDAEANFTSGNHTICPGNDVSFSNSSLHANSYLWLLPGSNNTTSTQINPTVIYNTPGTYDVTLIAYGAATTDTITMHNYITVNSQPFADFNSSNTTIQLPNAIALFTNNSLFANTYFWNFGDGTSSTDLNPFHIYTAAGNYTVTLIASNGLCPNDTLILTNYITVLNASGINGLINSSLSIIQNENLISINPGNKSFDDVSIQITDELGRICWSKKFIRISETKNIEIPNLHGIHIITIISKKEIINVLKWVNIN